MPTINTKSYVTSGIEVVPVTVTTTNQKGIGIHLVGLQDVEVKEVLLRTCTALQSLGYHIPGQKITISIRADDGRAVTTDAMNLDLAVAVSILAATEQIQLSQEQLDSVALVGGLGLDGSLREIRNGFGIAVEADKVILPKANARILKGLPEVKGSHKVIVASGLNEAIHAVTNQDIFNIDNITLMPKMSDEEEPATGEMGLLNCVQPMKRALEIAAAGGHNINLVTNGSASVIIKCLHSILPPMTKEEYIQTGNIYQLRWNDIPRTRPVRVPSSVSSITAIVGGGGSNIQPGEVSLANNGLLVLLDLYNWPNVVTETVRRIWEDRKVTISRLRNKAEFPADFQVVGTQSPCPCYTEAGECYCTQRQKQNYNQLIADKCRGLFDMSCYVGQYTVEKEVTGVTSEEVRKKVEAARRIQAERYSGTGITRNCELRGELLNRFCKLPNETQKALDRLVEAHGEKAEGMAARLKRIARTIADLEGSKNIEATHIVEAGGYVNEF